MGILKHGLENHSGFNFLMLIAQTLLVAAFPKAKANTCIFR